MKVVIMSGISGSGKSTYAEKILTETEGIKVSADHYFINRGEYQFQPHLLGQAHADCFRRFIDYCQSVVNTPMSNSTLVVDNTNLSVEEISPYVLAAQAFDIAVVVKVITLMPYSVAEMRQCAERNLHQVSLETVERQFSQLLKRQLPSRWIHQIVPVSFQKV